MFGSVPVPSAPQPPTITLTDAFGWAYYYQVYDRYGDWLEVPGNYAFGYLKPGIGSGWEILYLGEAQNVKTRMRDHERWWEAVGHGATHVLGHVNWGMDAARKDEERRLIAHLNPILNRQHRTGIGLGASMGIGGLGDLAYLAGGGAGSSTNALRDRSGTGAPPPNNNALRDILNGSYSSDPLRDLIARSYYPFGMGS
jgi:hypothetical protein